MQVTAPSAEPRTDLQEPPEASPDRWAALGFLRFFLAAVVCCSHYFCVLSRYDDVPPLLDWLRQFNGFDAVLCFFVISGYSIAASLDRQPKGYALRRAVRLYPTYAASFLVALVPWFLAPGSGIALISGVSCNLHDVTRKGLILTAIGLASTSGGALGTFSQSWSLTCEVAYYAVAPMLKRLHPLAIAALMAPPIWFYTNSGRHHFEPVGFRTIFLLSWFWLAGWLYYGRRKSIWSLPVLAAALVCLLNDFAATPNYRMLMIVVAAFALAETANLPPIVSRIGRYLGDLSYPLYLTHLASFVILSEIASPYLHDVTGVYFLFACLVSAAILHAVDLPIRRFARMKHA